MHPPIREQQILDHSTLFRQRLSPHDRYPEVCAVLHFQQNVQPFVTDLRILLEEGEKSQFLLSGGSRCHGCCFFENTPRSGLWARIVPGYAHVRSGEVFG